MLEALTTAPAASGVAVGERSSQKQDIFIGTAGAAGEPAPVVCAGREVKDGEAERRVLPFPAARRAVVRRLYDPVTGDLLDEALVLWMPGPRRYFSVALSIS